MKKEVKKENKKNKKEVVVKSKTKKEPKGKEIGYKNLIPLNKRSKEEQRKIQINGGKKSGEVRRARKTLKETLLDLLSDKDTQKDICQKLLKGKFNSKTFAVIRDTIGEKPVEKVAETDSEGNDIPRYEIDFGDSSDDEDTVSE